MERQLELDTWRCPVCGSIDPEWFYANSFGDIQGCEDCLHKEDAYTLLRRKAADAR